MPPFGSIGHTRTGNATVNALTTWSVLVAALLRGSNCPAHPAGSENVMLLVSELDAQSDPMFAMAAAMNREIPSTLLGGSTSPEEARPCAVRCMLWRTSDRCAELIGETRRVELAHPIAEAGTYYAICLRCLRGTDKPRCSECNVRGLPGP